MSDAAQTKGSELADYAFADYRVRFFLPSRARLVEAPCKAAFEPTNAPHAVAFHGGGLRDRKYRHTLTH
jgi:hypothetical protein